MTGFIVDGPDSEISEELLESWIRAIDADNTMEVKHILDNVSGSVRVTLLNGILPEWKPTICGHSSCDCYPSFLPYIARHSMMMAMGSCSFEVLNLFLQTDDVNILTSIEKLNLVHILLYACFFGPHNHDKYIEWYRWFCEKFDRETIKTLLGQEDSHGLNPLELAAHLDLHPIFNVIFNTPGVYLAKTETRHLCTCKWYDVTDYEHPDSERLNKSPLLMLSYLDHDKLSQLPTQEFIQSPLIQTWFNKKFQVMKPFVAMHVLVMLCKTALISLIFNSLIVRQGLFPEIPLNTANSNNATEVIVNATEVIVKLNCLWKISAWPYDVFLLSFAFLESLFSLCLCTILRVRNRKQFDCFKYYLDN